MVFERMPLEYWFDKWQYEVDYDIGESGMKFLTLEEMDIDLENVELRYGYHLGCPELRQLIANQYEGITMDNVAVTTGASEANFSIISHLVGKNDHVVVEHPTYPSLYQVPRSLERDLTLFHLRRENNFKPDLDELDQIVKPETTLISLTHPNNPTGSMIDESQIKRAIEIAEDMDAHLMVDETYRDLTFREPPRQAATLSLSAISITSMSKVYGLPGIRIGWAIAEEPVIQAIRTVREQITICNSALGEAIAIEVLRQRDAILGEMETMLSQNYAILKDWMEEQSWLEWVEPEGGMVCAPWLANGESTKKLCQLLVKKYRTFTVPGYGLEMDKHLRIGFGGEKEELIEGLNRLEKALKDLYG
ncbi:MAG: aminotransferase class I/II-fold pyridoxal phosphate-dependent enzyme [Candidatus Lokiarchaeota archaeon]|nr:aminotransferase class I/II-fold pyridoxal phosphate-dependent enzyme [Candidatus Lokiarchaeota archaeon]